MNTSYIQGVNYAAQLLKVATAGTDSAVTRKLRAIVTYAYENDLPDQFIETAKDQIIGKVQDTAINKAHDQALKVYDYEKKRRQSKADF